MKRLILFTAAMIAFFSFASPLAKSGGSGIRFSDKNFAEAVKEAKAEKKLIFIDLYATWCGPCKLLKLRTFPNKEVGSYFNAHFVSLSLDGEKGDGGKLFSAYQFRAFPTLLVLDSEAKPILVTEGYIDPKTLIEFGKAAVEKSSESK